MLAEGFVALIALVTIMIAAPAAVQGKPAGTIYGEGIGSFLTLLVGEQTPDGLLYRGRVGSGIAGMMSILNALRRSPPALGAITSPVLASLSELCRLGSTAWT